MAKLRLSKSESEVIAAIKGEARLPYRGNTGIMRHKRHDKAIERLKQKGVIVKGEDSILKIVPGVNLI